MNSTIFDKEEFFAKMRTTEFVDRTVSRFLHHHLSERVYTSQPPNTREGNVKSRKYQETHLSGVPRFPFCSFLSDLLVITTGLGRLIFSLLFLDCRFPSSPSMQPPPPLGIASASGRRSPLSPLFLPMGLTDRIRKNLHLDKPMDDCIVAIFAISLFVHTLRQW
jgi:hypothetical protein